MKRKRKRREWAPGSAERAQGTRQDRVKCRFYLEGRCNKVGGFLFANFLGI